jgi:hypothetical protein
MRNISNHYPYQFVSPKVGEANSDHKNRSIRIGGIGGEVKLNWRGLPNYQLPISEFQNSVNYLGLYAVFK